MNCGSCSQISSSCNCPIEEFMSWNHRTYVVNLQEVNIARKSRHTRRKNIGEASKHSPKVSQSFLVNLEVPSVSENRRDDKYVLRKLNLLKCSEENKWSRTALSFILCPDYVYRTLHLSEMKNCRLDRVEVEL